MSFDFLIIGAGIAGASVGYFLSRHARVLVLERESQPGYHTTGRSAALFAESYGTPQVRALTLASRSFFERPPDEFTQHPILGDRGAMFVATPDQMGDLESLYDELRGENAAMRWLSADAAMFRVPVLRRERLAGAVLDPMAADMDVHALHQGYLRGLRAHGGELRCNADVRAVERSVDRWHVHAGDATYSASVIVNAAGAWCDVVARLAGVPSLGLVPRRRSAFTFAPPDDVDCLHWPTVIGVDESYYFKPDAGQLMGSPANADAVEPQDVQPEAEDIATGIWRIEEATTLTIRRPRHTWAGLRSFVSDGDLVGGFDGAVPGFFWCAAQGGYGIQTSAAMGEACAALALGRVLPPAIAAFGLTPAMLSPGREALTRGST